jgi:hypothetical protein
MTGMMHPMAALSRRFSPQRRARVENTPLWSRAGDPLLSVSAHVLPEAKRRGRKTVGVMHMKRIIIVPTVGVVMVLVLAALKTALAFPGEPGLQEPSAPKEPRAALDKQTRRSP